MASEKQNLTVSELAVYLGIGRKKAYDLVNSANFPSFRIGTKILVNVHRLQEWIDANIQEAHAQ